MPAASLLLAVALTARLGPVEPTTTLPDTDFSVASVGRAFLVTCVVAVPLGITVWALLDAARRPRWAWALSPHRQVLWLAVIMAGVLSVVGGPVISVWYLTRVRPRLAALESGDLGP